MRKLLLIDGNAVMHRAYHALPPLTTKNGEPIGAVYGFISMFLRVIDELKPTHIAIAFDRAEPTFRKEMHEEYQSHRPEMDDELSSQFEKARRIAEAFNIPVYDKAGFEADDVIGTIAKNSDAEKVYIVTGDKDILQLVDDKIRVYLPARGLSNGTLMTPSKVKEKLGVTPKQVVDYKALVGDPSDNYKGVPGIGPKTATGLIDEYKSFENIYKNLDKISDTTKKKLLEGKESGEMSLKLAKIVTDVDTKFDLKKAKKWNIGSTKAVLVFREFGFKTLTKRIQEFAGGQMDFETAAAFIAKKLTGTQYAIRGTASLVLQGLDMNADDIDVLTDKKTALACNTIFKDFLAEEVKYKESGKYKSYIGNFLVSGMSLEVYGDWWIDNKFFDASDDEVTVIKVKGQKVRVTTIDTELAMFATQGRFTALQKIKKQLETKDQKSLF